MAITLKDLEQFRQLQKEAAQLAKRLEKMTKSSANIVSDSVKGSSNDIRAKETTFVITGLDQRNRLNYERVQRRLENRATRISTTLLLIEEFVDTVTDSEIRRIIDYRYVQGLPWKAVAQRVYDYPSETRARVAMVRYFEKN